MTRSRLFRYDSTKIFFYHPHFSSEVSRSALRCRKKCWLKIWCGFKLPSPLFQPRLLTVCVGFKATPPPGESKRAWTRLKRPAERQEERLSSVRTTAMEATPGLFSFAFGCCTGNVANSRWPYAVMRFSDNYHMNDPSEQQRPLSDGPADLSARSVCHRWRDPGRELSGWD